MNDLSEIVNYIMEKGQSDADIKNALQKEKYGKLTEKELQEVKDYEEAKLQKVRSNAEKELRMKKNRIQLDSRKKIQSAKHEYLNLAFDEAEKKLHQMDENEFLSLVSGAIKNPEFIGEFNITLGEKTAFSIDQNKIDSLGSTIKLNLNSKKIPQEGGFLLEQRGIEYNYLFSDMMARLKEEIGHKVIDALFGEGGENIE